MSKKIVLAVVGLMWLGFALFTGSYTASLGHETFVTGFFGGAIIFPLFVFVVGYFITVLGYLLPLAGTIFLLGSGLLRLVAGKGGGGWRIILGLFIAWFAVAFASAGGAPFHRAGSLSPGETFASRFWKKG